MVSAIPFLMGLQPPPPVPPCAPRRTVRTVQSWALPEAEDETQRQPSQRAQRVAQERDRVVAYLKRCGKSRHVSISEALNISPAALHRRLYELQDEKRVRREAAGRTTLWSALDA